MTVSIILAGKGREVVTIEPGAACRCRPTPREKRIGAALISAPTAHRRHHLRTRHVRTLAARGASALGEPVAGR